MATASPRTNIQQARHPLHLMLGRKLAPPRFLAFLALLPLGTIAHHHWIGHWLAPQTWTQSLVAGFDLAALAFVLSLLPLLREGGADAIRSRADANDANRTVVLLMTTLLTVVIMAAIAGELPAARNGEAYAVAFLILTLLLTWLFANSVYALHYAHDFYSPHPGQSGADCGGIDFPGTPEPGYLEFAYFAFTLGMTFQTSDVAITAPRIRAIALLHCFAAFVFNLGVIAFTINALGGGG